MVKRLVLKKVLNLKELKTKKTQSAFRWLGLFIVFLFAQSFLCAESSCSVDEAKKLAEDGAFKDAYEKLVIVVKELQAELGNLEGLVEYYKEELEKLSGGRPQVIDYKYNEAANRLWASAWRLQHDGVFKKMGKEKEECLQKAIDTFKRIVIDYPYADKAEEAQYRVGRVYYRFLKEYKSAETSLERYLNMYPKGNYVGTVRGMLRRIRRK